MTQYKASELVGKDAKVYVGFFFEGKLTIDGKAYCCMMLVGEVIRAYEVGAAGTGVVISPDTIVEVKEAVRMSNKLRPQWHGDRVRFVGGYEAPLPQASQQHKHFTVADLMAGKRAVYGKFSIFGRGYFAIVRIEGSYVGSWSVCDADELTSISFEILSPDMPVTVEQITKEEASA